jgi:hypothetical protein
VSKKFDVIIGNPPYSKVNGSDVSANNMLWADFLSKSVNELLINDGRIAFLTPNTWMSPNNKISQLFRKNNVIFININNVNKFFEKVGSTFSWYIIEKSEPKNKTQICSENGTFLIDLSKNKYIPNIVSDTIFSILSKTVFSNLDKIPFQKNNQQSEKNSKPNQDLNYNFPAIVTKHQKIYSSVENKFQYNLKLIMIRSGSFLPIKDYGENGFTRQCLALIVENEIELENAYNVLTSKLYKFILTICKWSGFNHLSVIADLPIVDFSVNWTNEKLYEYFNLTKNEILTIEGTIK